MAVTPVTRTASAGTVMGQAARAGVAAAPPVAAVGGVSLRPSDMVDGGLMDDVDVEFLDSRFTLWDYDGKAPQVLAIAVEMKPLDEDKSFLQYYSAGDPKYFVPSEDGKRAIPVGDKAGLNTNTNAAKFLESLVTAGFPEDQIGDDITVMTGTQAHVRRVAQKERAGLVRNARPGNENRPSTVLLVESVLRLPWEAAAAPVKAAGGKANGKAAPAPAPRAAAPAPRAAAPAPAPVAEAADAGEPSEAENKLTIFIVDSIATGPVSKAKLTNLVFKQFQADPDRNAIVKLCGNQDFLGNTDAPWAYDGTNLSQPTE